MLEKQSFSFSCLLALAGCAALALAAANGDRALAQPGPRGAAVLTISAQPQPAKVFLDSADLGYAPIRIPQNDTMLHQLKVEAPWFRTWTMPVKFDPRADRVINATLRHQEGMLIIVTEPAGATIRINGKMAGYAPQTLAGQPAGIYEVNAELAGYQPSAATVTVNDDQVSTWNPALEAKLGQVAFKGWPPGAAISSQKTDIGTMPMLWDNVKAGSYKFEIRCPGFEPVMVNAIVNTEAPTDVIVDLRPTRALTAVTHSLLVPGSGQIYRGSPAKGLLIKGLSFVAVAALTAAFNDRNSRFEKLDELERQYKTTISDYELYYQQVQQAYDVARTANRRLNIVIGLAAATYIVNLLDAAIFCPNRDEFRHAHAPAAR